MWKHEKLKGKTYFGDYERQKNGQTWFFLICNEKPKLKPKKFRSWQAAKKAGWIHS